MPYLARQHQLIHSLNYHIYNRGNARVNIYHHKDDYHRFIEILIKYSRNRGLFIWHWVLMPNHFHLLVWIERPRDLSPIMAGISRSYVHYHHNKYRAVGHLFQGRFKAQAIENERYLLACVRYIERNPVRAGMTERSENYDYSSAKFYTAGGNDVLTQVSPVYHSMGKTSEEQRKNYCRYLMVGSDKEADYFRKGSPVLGGMGFRRQLVKQNGQFVPRRKGRPRGGDDFS